jgi:VanZ family protein
LRTFLKYNLWAILWGLFIILLTALPGKVLPKLPVFLNLFHPDKLVHLFIFGVYFILQIRGFMSQPVVPFVRRNAAVITMAIGITLAVGTELLQNYFIPLRIGSVYDFIANVAGCLIGWGIAGRLTINR